MGILNAVRSSYGALRLLSGLTKVINPFCRRFDRAENCAARARAALPPGPINGQGLGALQGLPDVSQNVYDLIVRRFLSIFFPPAVYRKISSS